MLYECRRCNNLLPEKSFRIRKDRTNYRVKSCRGCEKKENAELESIKKIAPPKPNSCDCCGKVAKLYLDHCHESLSFRGWICNSCNFGIGSLGDNLEGLQKAIQYLRSA